MATPLIPTVPIGPQRIRVFVDYWNFQLALNRVEAKERGVALETARVEVDWKRLGQWLAKQAYAELGVTGGYSFDGVTIYTSFNPSSPGAKKFHSWATTWLDRQPGVKVECRERKRKAPPKCPVCHKAIEYGDVPLAVEKRS